MIRKTLAATMLLSSVALAPVAGAQESHALFQADRAVAAVQNQSVAVQAGISREAISRHIRSDETSSIRDAVAAQARERRGRTLMIVGGAAFLAGLIIGDDAGNAIAIGGALVGIYGLYLWAQTQP
jgi:hypothetical protein